MLKLLNKILFLSWVCLFPAFFASCSLLERYEAPGAGLNQTPVLEPTKFKILLVHTPLTMFYDFASFKYNKLNKNLIIELYKLGKPIGEIVVSQKEVCMMKNCISKWIAAKKFFGDVSYPGLLDDILAARDVFDGEGKRINKDGALVQWFVKGGQEIYYERNKNKVLFQNLTLRITIGIEDYIPQTPES